MAPVLYFLCLSPPCQAVLLMTKIIDVKLKIETTNLLVKKDHLTPSFLKMNPAHTIPTLDDNGFYLWESRAIMGYLIQQYGKDDKLYPKDPKKRAKIYQMLFYDASTLYSSIATYFMCYIRFKVEPTPEMLDAIQSNVQVLDQILSKSTYVTGEELSIADLSLVVIVATLDALRIDYSQNKHLTKWVQKVKGQLGSAYAETVQPGLDDFRDLINKMRAEIKK